jgi:SAM-dependent methyltransferase
MNSALAQIFDRVLTPEPWCIDNISYDGEMLEISGWALAPEGLHDSLTFTVNDHQFEEIEFPLPRPNVAEVFWYKRGAEKSGFRCRSSISRIELFKDGYAILKCVDRKTGLPVREEFNIYYPESGGPELPDVERRVRVWGSDNPESFYLEGFSTFKKIELSLLKTSGRALSDFGDILDWGCGCGRVTRNFYSQPRARIVGLDIDQDNINWCREHFSFGDYRVAPLRPPTDVADKSYDLIIGISVFSHLKEQDQRAWLGELLRLARPGAILLMSTLGESAAARSYWSREMWQQWQATGFVVAEDGSGLGSIIGDHDYYVTTFLTEAYIRQNWSRAFEILDFTPGYISNLQDLVVMRKPA